VVAGCTRDSSERASTLAAAASLRIVLPSLLEAFERAVPGGGAVDVSYGPSGGLEKQVTGGAPIDAVLFASGSPVSRLIDEGLVDPESRRLVATNRLVLIAKSGAGAPYTFDTLGSLPDGDKLAIGEPGAVPAGAYAKEALLALGQWDQVEDNLVYAGDVAMVLAYARRGEVAAAIVYATDARGVDDIDVLGEARGAWAPRAEVVIGMVRGGSPRARAFLAFLETEEARKILLDHGFGGAD
jgi:molybdate transport system substrate-binding protein